MYLVEHARSLRESHTALVRQTVYINCDMMRAEAIVATNDVKAISKMQQRWSRPRVTMATRLDSHVTMTSLDTIPLLALRNHLKSFIVGLT